MDACLRMGPKLSKGSLNKKSATSISIKQSYKKDKKLKTKNLKNSKSIRAKKKSSSIYKSNSQYYRTPTKPIYQSLDPKLKEINKMFNMLNMYFDRNNKAKERIIGYLENADKPKLVRSKSSSTVLNTTKKKKLLKNPPAKQAAINIPAKVIPAKGSTDSGIIKRNPRTESTFPKPGGAIASLSTIHKELKEFLMKHLGENYVNDRCGRKSPSQEILSRKVASEADMLGLLSNTQVNQSAIASSTNDLKKAPSVLDLSKMLTSSGYPEHKDDDLPNEGKKSADESLTFQTSGNINALKLTSSENAIPSSSKSCPYSTDDANLEYLSSEDLFDSDGHLRTEYLIQSMNRRSMLKKLPSLNLSTDHQQTLDLFRRNSEAEQDTD